MVMSRRKMLRLIDVRRVQEAIATAETMTSGEIAVSVSRLFWGSVERAAQKAFVRLRVTQTRDHDGVLIFVVPARRRFVVLGDSGIHEKAGQEFWNHVAAAVSEKFRDGDFTGGLVRGIEKIGEELAAHFPYDPATDKDELANDVDFGGK